MTWLIRIIPMTYFVTLSSRLKIRNIVAQSSSGNPKLANVGRRAQTGSSYQADSRVRDLFRNWRRPCKHSFQNDRFGSMQNDEISGQDFLDGPRPIRAKYARLCGGRQADAMGIGAGYGLRLRQGRQNIFL